MENDEREMVMELRRYSHVLEEAGSVGLVESLEELANSCPASKKENLNLYVRIYDTITQILDKLKPRKDSLWYNQEARKNGELIVVQQTYDKFLDVSLYFDAVISDMEHAIFQKGKRKKVE